MEAYDKISFRAGVLVVILLFFSEYAECKECSGYLNGQYVKDTCAVGGCCIPSDGEGSTLCCLPTLTLILVSVFVGGTILVIIIVVVCCLVCRYRKKRKLRRRLEERRRRQRERDAERQRILMNDPFVNGDPFQEPVEGENAQPPRYHGQEDEHSAEHNTSSRPLARSGRQGIAENTIPPPYPNTPPPAYYSRIGTHPENSPRSRFTNNRLVSRSSNNVTTRTNSRIEMSREHTAADIQPEVTTEDTLSPRTPSPGPPTRRSNSNNHSRMNTNLSNTVISMNNANNQRNSRLENQRNVMTIEDLEEANADYKIDPMEEGEKADRLGKIAEIKPGSRLSTKVHLNYNENDRQSVIRESRNSIKADSRSSVKTESRTPKIDSRHSDKIDSRNSTRVMNSIFSNQQSSTQNQNRGRFIKSSVSTVSEDIERVASRTTSSSQAHNYVRSVDRDDPYVNNLGFV